MGDKENQDSSNQQSQQGSDSGSAQETGTKPKVTTSQDFEFTDSSFKRGQGSGDMEKRTVDVLKPSTVKKEEGN
jgi:hypothetical protein